MTLLKGVAVFAAMIILVVIAVPLIVVQIENAQSKKNEPLFEKPLPSITSPARVAVIVFSRSGNTAVLARHIAELHHADLYRLESPDYDPGLMGWINAMMDARQSEAVISPQSIDLSKYSTIYLGSPIWLYSPAPPIWKFVETNNFTGKDVILFNTFNSQFKQEFIDKFQQRLIAKGASSFKHQFVQRGRMGQQIPVESMLVTFDRNTTLAH